MSQPIPNENKDSTPPFGTSGVNQSQHLTGEWFIVLPVLKSSANRITNLTNRRQSESSVSGNHLPAPASPPFPVFDRKQGGSSGPASPNSVPLNNLLISTNYTNQNQYQQPSRAVVKEQGKNRSTGCITFRETRWRVRLREGPCSHFSLTQTQLNTPKIIKSRKLCIAPKNTFHPSIKLSLLRF